MPHITVELWKGCTKEQKAALASAITDAVINICNKRRPNIIVKFVDYETQDWAIGGQLACDIDWSKK